MTEFEVESLEDLRNRVDALVRGNLGQFESSLVSHGEPGGVDGTKSTLRCHFIRSDGNGLPRVAAFARQLAREVIFHCIPRSDIAALSDLDDPNDRIRELSRLHASARDLFTTNQENSGEGGELLLYALLEQGLGVPQILRKMSLKTNTNVQVHGTDGVHAKVLESGVLALYWGEAKIYTDLSSALTDCFESIAPYLQGKAADQDLWLLRHYADLGDKDLTDRVIQYFDDSSPKSADVEVRGACLVGFTHADYPVLPRDGLVLQEQLEAAVATWKKSIATRLKNRGISGYQIEVFLLPIPSADDFRQAILSEIR